MLQRSIPTHPIAILLAISALPAAEMAFKKVDENRKVPTDLEYKVSTAFPAKGPANAIFKTTVTVKNTGAAAKKFMLCAVGHSTALAKGVTSDVDIIDVTLNAGQFQCKAKGKETAMAKRVGNMGCQMVTIEKGKEAEIVFVTGQRPNPDTPKPLPIQNGVYNNKRNGAGFNGSGHRSVATKAQFGKQMPITDVIGDLTLHFILFDDPKLDMACRDKDAEKKEYVPPCAKVQGEDLACNQCFGMNFDFALPKEAKGYTVHTETVKFKDVLTAALMNIPFRLDTRLASAAPVPQNAYLTVLRVPSGLIPCDTLIPGCYKLTPPPDTYFVDDPSTLTDGLLEVSLPAGVASSFEGEFVISTRQADSTSIPPSSRDQSSDPVLQENRIRISPFRVCDVTGDTVVNIDDIGTIMSMLGLSVAPPSAADADGDGVVTVADARACTLRCAKPNCAK
jgi:hypothetical protein